MAIATIRNALLAIVAALSLVACGGAGGGGVASIPAPPVAPTQTSPPPPPSTSTTPANYMIAANTGDQTFSSKGGYVSYNPATGQPLSPTTTQGEQLQVRYNSGSSQYEIMLPSSSFWEGLYRNPQGSTGIDFRTSGTNTANSPTFVQLQAYGGTGYTYSALALWGISSTQAGISGTAAFGIPTPVGSVPVAGSATYNGSISGRSTETSYDMLAAGYWPAIVEGGIGLSFNFAAGTLSGSISPTIYNLERRALAPMTFVNTVYSTGATSFSGSFNTTLTGSNSFAGQFTGPQAQELIGSFQFPYTSPDDGKIYQANGAFVGKQ